MDPLHDIQTKLDQQLTQWKEEARHEILVSVLETTTRANLDILMQQNPAKAPNYQLAKEALK